MTLPSVDGFDEAFRRTCLGTTDRETLAVFALFGLQHISLFVGTFRQCIVMSSVDSEEEIVSLPVLREWTEP